MADTLTEYEYIWAVSATDLNDHTRNYIAYFTDQKEAGLFANDQHPSARATVVQTTLWKDQNGHWYKVSAESVPVDITVLRRKALNKLDAAERQALGL